LEGILEYFKKPPLPAKNAHFKILPSGITNTDRNEVM